VQRLDLTQLLDQRSFQEHDRVNLLYPATVDERSAYPGASAASAGYPIAVAHATAAPATSATVAQERLSQRGYATPSNIPLVAAAGFRLAPNPQPAASRDTHGC
jgi:hypothetical protein